LWIAQCDLSIPKTRIAAAKIQIVDMDNAICRYGQFVLLMSAFQIVDIDNWYQMTIPLAVLVR